jgi:hypothetical protein
VKNLEEFALVRVKSNTKEKFEGFIGRGKRTGEI